MRFNAILLALVATATALAGCGDSGATPAVTRTVDVSELTFADVQQRARDASTKPGAIFHLTDTRQGGNAGNSVSETWLDLERHLARIERNGELQQVFGPSAMAMLHPGDGRYAEALYSWDGIEQPLLGFSLDYLARIVGQGVESKGIEESVIDGAPAIELRVQQETNADGDRRTEKATIYLDEGFLPLKMELDIGAGVRFRTTHTYRSEYVARDAVLADFFSFEQIRAKAKTSADVLREAAKPFGRTYWFGEPFESMVVETISSNPHDDGEPFLDFTYGLPDAGSGGPDAPFPCAGLSQYTRRGWDNVLAARRQNPDAPRPIERETRAAFGGEARIYELAADRVLEQPHVEGQPAPTPATLAEWSVWEVEIELPDAVVVLRVNCGPPGKNPYRSIAGVRRLLDALQPLDLQ